jgi:chromosome segregation ATPase
MQELKETKGKLIGALRKRDAKIDELERELRSARRQLEEREREVASLERQLSSATSELELWELMERSRQMIEKIKAA